MKITIRLILFSIAISLPKVNSWGKTVCLLFIPPAVAKKLAGQIASHFVSQDTQRELNTILPPQFNGKLGSACSWADEIKGQHSYDWSKPLHYIAGKIDNEDDEHMSLPLACSLDLNRDCANGICIVEAIRNYTVILLGNPSFAAKQEAILFLIHFIGDIHNPLHNCGKFKGGNTYFVKWENKTRVKGWNGQLMNINLHSLWDEVLLHKIIKDDFGGCLSCFEASLLETVNNGTYPVEKWRKCPADELQRVNDDGDIDKLTHKEIDVCPLVWSTLSGHLNCESIWVGVNGTYVDLAGEYYQRNKKVVVRQIVKAGIRMAHVLDQLFEAVKKTGVEDSFLKSEKEKRRFVVQI